MFKGHFANMGRLANDGVLVYAGPMDGVDGWRGIFIMAVTDIATARQHAETDPVLQSGEMVAEYHLHFGSAALVGVPEAHSGWSNRHPRGGAARECRYAGALHNREAWS